MKQIEVRIQNYFCPIVDDQVGQGGLDLWLVDQIVISDFNHIFEAKENSFSKVEKGRRVLSTKVRC